MFDRADKVIDSIPIEECVAYYNYFTRSKLNFTDSDYKLHLKAKIRDCGLHSKIRLKGKTILSIENIFRFYNQLSWINYMIDKYSLSNNLKYPIKEGEFFDKNYTNYN
jgi:hypothetical protein